MMPSKCSCQTEKIKVPESEFPRTHMIVGSWKCLSLNNSLVASGCTCCSSLSKTQYGNTLVELLPPPSVICLPFPNSAPQYLPFFCGLWRHHMSLGCGWSQFCRSWTSESASYFRKSKWIMVTNYIVAGYKHLNTTYTGFPMGGLACEINPLQISDYTLNVVISNICWPTLFK